MDPTRLHEIAEELREGKEPPPVTVREFLSWFGASRRGYWIVENIRIQLDNLGLATQPDFESAYIDSHIKFELQNAPEVADPVHPAAAPADAQEHAAEVRDELISSAYRDPTYRISKLASANTRPVSVTPDTSLAAVVTIMMQSDFSQIPVMTSDRDVKGIVSWSSIGSRLALGRKGATAREMMEPHQEVLESTSIFAAIPLIVRRDYVLVRARDNRISGIVTASDLSVQFQSLSEPFLLLGEIENQIRRIIEPRFKSEELASLRSPADGARKVERVADLNFGEYIRLLEEPTNWGRLGVPVDRGVFCRELDRIRQIRNDVMHFDPDGIPPSDIQTLRQFSEFLQRLQDMQAL